MTSGKTPSSWYELVLLLETMFKTKQFRKKDAHD